MWKTKRHRKYKTPESNNGNISMDNEDYEYLFLALYQISHRYNTSPWKQIRQTIQELCGNILKRKGEDGVNKICSKCGRVLPLSRFWSKKNGKYGKHAECGECLTSSRDKSRAKMGNGYIKDLLVRQFNMKREEIPQKLIKSKRKILQSKRLTKLLKEAYPNEGF
jgi:hypothetical protein